MQTKPALEKVKDDGQTATVDELKEINLGTEEESHPTFISALLSIDKVKELKSLLYEFMGYFAWTCRDARVIICYSSL